ncbi:MAG TPA: hypothetical protein VEV82_00390 [Actinomycetota bacterium]|nr:hypothetical protein [Actinomycetota bacterium]
MSDSSSDSSTGTRVGSSYEDGTEVLSGESGGVAIKTAPVEHEKNGSEPKLAPTPDTAETEAERDERRGWLPLAVGVFLVVAIAALAIILLLRTGSPQVQLGEAGERGVENQANWKFKSFTTGGKHPSGEHPKPPKQQTQAVEQLVRDWNDALILSPGQFGDITKKYFAPPAGNAITSSDFGLPQSANQVDTTKRRARIGIEADGAKRAVVDVSLVARGKSDEGEFRVESDSTLYLERTGSKWHVIAFDVDQRPLPLNPKKGPKNDGGKSNGDSGSKKKGSDQNKSKGAGQ